MNPYSDPIGPQGVTPRPSSVRLSSDAASSWGSAASDDEVSVLCDAGAHERCYGASCACSCHTHAEWCHKVIGCTAPDHCTCEHDHVAARAAVRTAPTPAIRSRRFVSRLDWDSPRVKTFVIISCVSTAAVVALGMCLFGILLAAGGAL